MQIFAASSAAALAALAPIASARPAYQVCFTPGQDCTGLVVAEIAGAHRSILVQAYSFTSVPILAALKAAHARGVDVEVIVDKTSVRVSKSGSRYSQNCTGLVVGEMAGARRSIFVQAYSFTSVPILAALKAAHDRGVDVKVLVDKTSVRVSKSGSRYSGHMY
jgi:phosphatidylserine/phosphatidylglycerophosphate/cardiolipin synthase-like enzyme